MIKRRKAFGRGRDRGQCWFNFNSSQIIHIHDLCTCLKYKRLLWGKEEEELRIIVVWLYFLKSLSSAPLPARFLKSLFCRRKKNYLTTQFEFPLWQGNKFCNAFKPTRELKLLYEKTFWSQKTWAGGATRWSAFYFPGYNITYHTVHAKNMEDKPMQKSCYLFKLNVKIQIQNRSGLSLVQNQNINEVHILPNKLVKQVG